MNFAWLIYKLITEFGYFFFKFHLINHENRWYADLKILLYILDHWFLKQLQIFFSHRVNLILIYYFYSSWFTHKFLGNWIWLLINYIIYYMLHKHKEKKKKRIFKLMMESNCLIWRIRGSLTLSCYRPTWHGKLREKIIN